MNRKTKTKTNTNTNNKNIHINLNLNPMPHHNSKNRYQKKHLARPKLKHTFKHIHKHTHTHTHKHKHNHNHNPESNTTHKNYISELVNLYYNNDNVVNNFIKYRNTKQHIFPEHRRVIVIGDIHGDFDVAIKCLILSRCIKTIEVPKNKSIISMDKFFKSLEWIGDDTYIVQLGDQIDRVRPQKWDNNEITRDNAYKDEGSTLEIFYLFYHLDNMARTHNGRVFSIIGNHEIMNIEGDFRYVSLEEFKCFKEHLESVYHKHSKFPYHSRTLKRHSYKLENSKKTHNNNNNDNNNNNNNNDNNDNKYAKLPDGYKERLYSFSPTGLCANMIGSNYYTILQIGNWLFCHGSPVTKTLKTYTTEMINNYVSMYLLGMKDDNTYHKIDKNYYNITKSGETEITNGLENSLLHQLDNILNEYNTKNTKLQNSINNCKKASHIAVGHTIQDTKINGINSICNNRVWRCDVAMSKAFGNNKISKYRKPQVLEIINGTTTNVLI